MSLSTQIKAFVLMGTLVALAALWSLYCYEHQAREHLASKLDRMTAQRDALLVTFEQQTKRIQSFAVLSQQHAKELNDAENALDSLRDELRFNTKRLLVYTKRSQNMCHRLTFSW